MEETLDSVNDDEELEQEADEEVDKVLYELTDGKLGQAGRVGGELPVGLVWRNGEGQSSSLRRRRRTRRRTRQRCSACGERWTSCSARRLAPPVWLLG